MELDLHELVDLSHALAEDPKRVLSGARRLVVAHAGRIGDSMASRIPEGPGQYGIHTADSVTFDGRARQHERNPFAEAGPEHFVARFLEYGTVKMAPQPFVDASVDENIQAIDGDFADLLAALADVL